MGDSDRRATQIGDIRFNDRRSEVAGSIPTAPNPTKLKRRQLADVSPVRAIPVNVNQSLSVIRNFEHFHKKARKELDDKPQQKYHEFMSLDQAGPATIAYDQNYNLYTIRKVKTKVADTSSIQLFRDIASVVSIQDIFSRGDIIQIVYEYMETSLQNILATPRGHLAASEIAIICKEVLSGLSFIHERLDLHYGDLRCGQVLLDRAGHIKLRYRMLDGYPLTEEQKQKDARSVGTLMMEIMEPATSLERSGSVLLQHPERWGGEDADVRRFLTATTTSSISELKDHQFLLSIQSRTSLIPHILMAQVSVRTD